MLKFLSEITFEMYMYYLGEALIILGIVNLFSCLDETYIEKDIIESIIYFIVGVFLIFYFKSKI